MPIQALREFLTSWDSLHGAFEMKRINHQEAYCLHGACSNWAEEYFSRLRRAEAGHHHHIARLPAALRARKLME
jgi:hypothetical protein